MSVSGAFNNAVSGMNAQSTRLSSISQNIANSSTVGYKSVDTQFEDMVLSGTSGELADSLAGVSTTSRSSPTVSGQITTTGVSTDVAVDGSGFLVVNTQSDSSTGTYLATRAGSFRADASGDLVNSAGYYLQGVALNADGTAVGGNTGSSLDSLSTVNINSVQSSAAATTSITFAANLPSSDTAYSTTTATSDTSTVDYYDALGTSNTLTFTFTPTQAAASGDAQTNTWTVNIYDSASATPTTPVGTATLVFNDSSSANAGTLSSVTTTAGTYDSTTGMLTVNTGTSGSTPVEINIGQLNSSSGLTQYDGDYQTTKIDKDGASYGTLTGVTITDSGVVTAAYSNGTTRPIYQLKLATVANPEGMTSVSGDAYAFTNASGVALLSNAGSGATGTVEGGALEGSNVDITEQLTNLIQTQRAYSSNSTVVQAGAQMLDIANQMYR